MQQHGSAEHCTLMYVSYIHNWSNLLPGVGVPAFCQDGMKAKSVALMRIDEEQKWRLK